MVPPPAAAATLAETAVSRVRDDPEARLGLMRRLYEHPVLGRGRLPYRRAVTAFMRWQLRRGLLDPPATASGGSPWWRAVNEDLLRVTVEAGYLAGGSPGPASSPAVAAAREFIERPTASRWYRAHNLAVVQGYLTHRELAEREDRVERFFLNLVLLRVLYAHALVAAPRLALGRLAPAAPPLGDPRLGMTGIFLSLSRVLPGRYPLGEDVEPYVAAEHSFGRFLDVGIIQPRLRALYDWSADELRVPALAELLVEEVPTYAWDPVDRGPWNPPVGRLARTARTCLPPP